MTNLLEHGDNRLFTSLENPFIERFYNIGREMTVASARKIKFCLMLSFRMLQQPRNSVRIDCRHVFERFIEFRLSCCISGFPKECCQIWILELFTEMGFEMLKAIAVRTAWEYTINCVKQSFLAI